MILLITTSSNQHVNTIESLIRDRGLKYSRIDTDTLFMGGLIVDIGYNGKSISINGDVIDLSNIDSVFCHHPQIYVPPNFGVDHLDKRIYQATWYNFISLLEYELKDKLWMNNLGSSLFISNVMCQLDIAKNIGFNIPNTIFTNNLSSLFKMKNDYGKVIVKSGNLRGVDMTGNRLLSHIINPEDVDETKFKMSPCIAQEYIEKLFEIRVNVIDDEVFSCRIDSQNSEATKVDWRNYNISETPHWSYNLSNNIKNMCVEMVRTIGVKFGVIDLIYTPNDEIFFLECNTGGHWLWIEKITNLNISESIVKRLSRSISV